MKRELKTVTQFAETSPFTEAQLRWFIFNAKTNGLKPAVVKVGRRVYLDVNAFDRWIEAQNDKAPVA